MRALNRSALCTDVCEACREKSTGTVQGWAGRYGRFGPLPPTACAPLTPPSYRRENMYACPNKIRGSSKKTTTTNKCKASVRREPASVQLVRSCRGRYCGCSWPPSSLRPGRRTSPPSWIVGALRRLRALMLAAPPLASGSSDTQRPSPVPSRPCARARPVSV